MNEKMRDNQKSAIDAGADKAKSATDWVAEKAEGVKDTAVNLAETVQDRAKTMARSFNETANRAKDKAGEWLGDAAEPVQKFVEQGYDESKKALNDFSRDATAMIRQYPLAAVAIGLGIGVLIGRVAGSRV